MSFIAKEYAKHDGPISKPVHILLSGSEVTGKSYLVKTTRNFALKSLLFNCKELEKLRVFLLGSTGISAVNTARKTTHSALGIKGDLANKRDLAKLF